jgi:ArsR family transcriptional regulator
MDKIVEMLKALGERNRFRIVMMLRSRPLCVCEMHAVLDISGATLSNHLKTLKYAGLVDSRRDGKWIEYYLKDREVLDLLDQFIHRMDERDQIDADTERLTRLSRSVCSTQGA